MVYFHRFEPKSDYINMYDTPIYYSRKTGGVNVGNSHKTALDNPIPEHLERFGACLKWSLDNVIVNKKVVDMTADSNNQELSEYAKKYISEHMDISNKKLAIMFKTTEYKIYLAKRQVLESD